jgi:hypothetical protein
LDKIDDVLFFLYGSTYPNGPCYKINPTKRSIEKCEKTQESCEEIDECDPAVSLLALRNFSFTYMNKLIKALNNLS